MSKLPRLMIAAPHSGSGKTSVTLALLAALGARDMKISSFKCGPDFVDPIFHRQIFGVSGYNLDLFFSTPQQIKSLLHRGAQGSDISIIEGVMGYYDGIGISDEASSWRVATETSSPAVLVISVGGAALSICAIIKGVIDFKTNSMIKGVILNNCGAALCQMLAPVIERECGIKVFGYLPTMPEAALQSRQLGLDTSQSDIMDKITLLGQQAERSLDLGGLIALANTAPDIATPPLATEQIVGSRVNVAVAKDEAFQFYYAENLELLESLGANLVYFSPLHDKELPENCSAAYIGGGYPEQFAQELSLNHSMLKSIKSAVADGMPTIAESGGFMYLQQRLEGADGADYDMVGALEGVCKKYDRLSRFGYITLTAQGDSLLADEGESIRAHEFHYWDSDRPGAAFVAKKPSGTRRWDCAVGGGTIYAGFPHLYLPSNPNFAKRFVLAAENYSKKLAGRA